MNAEEAGAFFGSEIDEGAERERDPSHKTHQRAQKHRPDSVAQDGSEPNQGQGKTRVSSTAQRGLRQQKGSQEE
jgi:hypothetical protein